MRAQRNIEFYRKAPEDMKRMEDANFRQGWNLTYYHGFNETELAETAVDTDAFYRNTEKRMHAQVSALEAKGHLPPGTQMDALSPCIMNKIYPSQFPDQPAVSLLLRLRGKSASPGDWPAAEPTTKAPPTGKGPEAVAAFVSRLENCRKVVTLELVVMLSGDAVQEQATTWAWQSWTTEGLVVPILDAQDREAHSLNRLASVARGSLLVALRADRPNVDDLVPRPTDCSWLQRLVTLYHRVPQLGAMAHGRYGFSHPPSPGSLYLLGHVPAAGGPHHNNMFFKEPMTSIPFQYVLYGDYMPMSFRASALEEVGGFDEDLPQGEELCNSLLRRDLLLRIWKSGWRVGAHDMGLVQEPEKGINPASNSDATRCPEQVAKLASELFESRHGPPVLDGGKALQAPMEVLMARVKELNLKQLQPMDADFATSCPMAQGCKL